MPAKKSSQRPKMNPPPEAAPDLNYRVHREPPPADPKRIFNVPGIVLFIAGLNFLFFGLMFFLPDRTATLIKLSAGLIPSQFTQGIEANGGFLRWASPLISHMFMHMSSLHLALNMVLLITFGPPVAARMKGLSKVGPLGGIGRASMFLSFYILCGVAGVLTTVLLDPRQFVLAAGASAAVAGLFGAMVRFALNRATLFGSSTAKISPLLSPTVLIWSIAVVFAVIIIEVIVVSGIKGANVAWEAHLGGYFFGLLTYPFFERAAKAYS
ncbi:MAG: rhomboid family intramembrane serine protease [Hyphococcus sp.]|nr:MAG: rhomboid family intramembrane serine protease [Marinicaulis sp.]